MGLLPMCGGDPAASSTQVAPFRCVRLRPLGLRLEGAGDATGLCCVKMMRGSRALEAAPRVECGLREEYADVCTGVSTPSKLAACKTLAKASKARAN